MITLWLVSTKFITGVNDTSDETVAKNVNINPAESQQNKKKHLVYKFFPVISGVVDAGNQPLLSNISANFRKIRNGQGNSQEPGGN